MFRSLDHLVIAVRDLGTAAERYRRLLGREASWRGTHPGLGTENVLFRLENTYVEILAPAGEGAFGDVVRARLAGPGEGLLALAFGTEDPEICARSFVRAGLSPVDPVAGRGIDVSGSRERRWRTVMLPAGATRGVLLFAIAHEPGGELESVVPEGESTAAVSACDHVVVRTGDPEAARALYGELLGLRLALDRTFPDRGMRLLFFRVGGVTVEVAAPLGDPPPSSADELWGVSYRVEDVAAAHRRLESAGFEVSEVRTGRRPGTRVFTVHGETHGVATLFLGPE